VAYTWDAEGRMLTDTPYGSPTISATYDALGRMVERGASGSYTQTIYTPTGVPMTMQGQSLAEAYVPLSGGAWAVYYSTVLNAYWHPDWQGNVRLQSSPTRTVLADIAYGPYGEMYVSSGVEPFYGGMFQRTSWEIYDATFRRYQFTQGRWISPDPAGLTAVDPNYPQSLNRYGYVMNSPTTLTDPLGLFCRKGEGCPTGNESDDDQDLASYERWYRRIKLVLIPPLPPLPPPPQPPQFLTELIVPVPCSDLFTLADQQNYNVTTQFNQIDPLHPEGHKGMDFSAPKGTSVNIQFEGDITFNGPASRFGNAVAVSKDFEVAPGISLGVTYVFGHGALEPGLAVGQQVSPGDQIMSVGSLGRSNGPHLHVQKSTNDRFKGPFQQPCTP
jgi:RHS repeat-associated protein